MGPKDAELRERERCRENGIPVFPLKPGPSADRLDFLQKGWMP